MKKQIKLQTEYSITIPLWYGDGWEGKVGPIESNQVDFDSLGLSEILLEQLRNLQKPTNDYFRIMEAIPGGGWSHHTEEEFEKARLVLEIPPFLSTVELGQKKEEVLKRLRKELPDGFEII